MEDAELRRCRSSFRRKTPPATCFEALRGAPSHHQSADCTSAPSTFYSSPDTTDNCTNAAVCMGVYTLYGTVFTLTWKHTDPSTVHSISIYCILFIRVYFYFILFCFLWVNSFPVLLLFVLFAHCSPLLKCQIEVLQLGIVKGTPELVLFYCLNLWASTDYSRDLKVHYVVLGNECWFYFEK